jgi:glycosyltransferase involved in cell wall biosynthesis
MTAAGGKMRLGIVATHPIQYQVPWFRALAHRPEIDLTVYFVEIPDAERQGIGFGQAFQWDIPMLEGYRYQVLGNAARDPGLDRFRGTRIRDFGRCLTRDVIELLLVTGWNSLSLLQAAVAARLRRLPVAVRGDSNALVPRSFWAHLGHRLLLQLYQGFLYVGASNREFYARHGIGENRLFFCPHFVDNQRLAESHRQFLARRSELRERWRIPPDRFCFLFCGKLVEKKQPFVVLRALEMLGGSNPSRHLLVVGAGELEAPLRNYAESRRLPVSFAGFLNQSEMPAAYAAADCLVLPSDYGETWGLVVNEAMACGLPAIVSDRVGCGPDLLRSERSGFVCPFGDIDALAERLREMSGPSSMSRSMGRAANSLVCSAYTVERAVEGVVECTRFLTEVYGRPTHRIPGSRARTRHG